MAAHGSRYQAYKPKAHGPEIRFSEKLTPSHPPTAKVQPCSDPPHHWILDRLSAGKCAKCGLER